MKFYQLFFQTSHIKDPCFRIEKEWRAIELNYDESKTREFNKDGEIIKYFDTPFDINSIKYIYVGSSAIQDDTCKELQKLLSKSKIKPIILKSTIPIEL